MTKLEILQSMRSLPFYTGGKSDQDIADYKQYRQLEKDIEEAARNLKKGDKVQFEWHEKLPGKDPETGFQNVRRFILEGEVQVPLKLKKREIYGEDCSIQVIKIASGKFIYPASPDSVVKI